VKSEAVLVDIASVKTQIAHAVESDPFGAGYLSIHPMFGPLRSFESRNICVVPHRANIQSIAFLNLLEKWKAKLIVMSAEEHDRNAAYVQSMTHAAILQITGTLQSAGLPLETMMALSTPVQRALLALCARIVSSDPALYWNIQAANPFAAQARRDYEKSWGVLSGIVDRSDAEAFKKLFKEIAEYLEPELPSLVELSEAIVEIARDER
jgi:prephenate dehydrogenase